MKTTVSINVIWKKLLGKNSLHFVPSVILTVYIEGDSCAFAGRNGQVGGHTAVVPSSVAVDRQDGQVAPCGHPLPVREHLLMTYIRHVISFITVKTPQQYLMPLTFLDLQLH